MKINQDEGMDEFEVYLQFSKLQTALKNEIETLKIQFEECRCISCRINYIEGNLHLIEVNKIVSLLESKLSPQLADVFRSADIKYTISKNGSFALKNQ